MTAASAAHAAPAERPLELVERSLAYARGVLVAVPGHPADLATPCADWDLGDLLAHMVDGFTAFVQAAAGVVSPEPPAGLPREPALLAGHLLDLGCGVLGEWASPAGRARVLCGLPLPTEVNSTFAGSVAYWPLACWVPMYSVLQSMVSPEHLRWEGLE